VILLCKRLFSRCKDYFPSYYDAKDTPIHITKENNMNKYIGMALLSCLVAYSQSALADTSSTDDFKHPINSTYTFEHDNDLSKLRQHEMNILNNYTKSAQYQINNMPMSNSKDRIDLSAENKTWYSYINKFCGDIGRYSEGGDGEGGVSDKNLCEINLIRERTYFIWGYFLHFEKTDMLNKPDHQMVFP